MGIKRFQPNVFDHNYQGLIDEKGQIIQLWGDAALSQSIKLWIASFQGDIVRKPKRAGYISYWLMKPMSTDNIDRIKMGIKDGVYQDFSPILTLEKLEVEADFKNRRWNIYMEIYSPSLKTKAVISESVKARI